MLWQLHGPEQQIFTKAEVVALLHISEPTLDRLIAAGRFPVGIKPGPQGSPLWTGLDIAVWLYLSPRLIVDEEKNSQTQRRSTGKRGEQPDAAERDEEQP